MATILTVFVAAMNFLLKNMKLMSQISVIVRCMTEEKYNPFMDPLRMAWLEHLADIHLPKARPLTKEEEIEANKHAWGS
jgi:hypothetical protein